MELEVKAWKKKKKKYRVWWFFVRVRRHSWSWYYIIIGMSFGWQFDILYSVWHEIFTLSVKRFQLSCLCDVARTNHTHTSPQRPCTSSALSFRWRRSTSELKSNWCDVFACIDCSNTRLQAQNVLRWIVHVAELRRFKIYCRTINDKF